MSARRRAAAVALVAALLLLGIGSAWEIDHRGAKPSINATGIANRGTHTPSPSPSPTVRLLPYDSFVGPGQTPTWPDSDLPGDTLPPAPSTATCDPSAVPDARALPPVKTPPAAGLRFHVPILMYHRIVPFAEAGNSLHSLVVPPEVFAAQMSALVDDGWETITMRQLGADLAAGIAPAPKTVVITFDDGYEDGYTYAFPILRSLGLVGTFFVIPGRIGHPENLTVDEVRALAAAGDEIGNHTMNHVDIRGLSSGYLEYEVWTASERLAQMTGQWPASFAYPFGTWDQAAVKALERCGPMRMAVTTQFGASETWANRFEEPRVRVNPETTPEALVSALQPFR